MHHNPLNDRQFSPVVPLFENHPRSYAHNVVNEDPSAIQRAATPGKSNLPVPIALAAVTISCAAFALDGFAAGPEGFATRSGALTLPSGIQICFRQKVCLMTTALSGLVRRVADLMLQLIYAIRRDQWMVK